MEWEEENNIWHRLLVPFGFQISLHFFNLHHLYTLCVNTFPNYTFLYANFFTPLAFMQNLNWQHYPGTHRFVFTHECIYSQILFSSMVLLSSNHHDGYLLALGTNLYKQNHINNKTGWLFQLGLGGAIPNYILNIHQ